MEIPVPSAENVKLAWEWTLKNLQLWLTVLRKPADMVETLDRESTDTLIGAIQFAVFPILLSVFIQLTPYLAIKDAPFGLGGYFVVCGFLYPAGIFSAAVSQRFSAIIVRGKGGLVACTISTLYATAFWPLMELVSAIQVSHRATYIKINKSDDLSGADVGHLTVDLLLTLALGIYLFCKFVPMTKVVHQVGRMRAIAITLLTTFFFILSSFLFKPLVDTMFFGASF